MNPLCSISDPLMMTLIVCSCVLGVATILSTVWLIVETHKAHDVS